MAAIRKLVTLLALATACHNQATAKPQPTAQPQPTPKPQPAASAPTENIAALDTETAFRKGVDAMSKGQFKEGLPYLKQAEKGAPGDPSVLWNLGIASAELGNHAEALGYWQRFRVAEPQDWKGIAKVVQAFQALGNTAARDEQIRALYERRAKGADAELRSVEEFCRDQFRVAGQRVFAFEFFEPQGERQIFYRFSVVDEVTGNEAFFISLGSYEATTQIARETGEIPKTARLYHVDRYERGLHGESIHRTYAFFQEKPSYETLRQLVVAVLEGKVSEMSSSVAPRSSGTR